MSVLISFLAEPDRSSLRNIQKTISADFNHTVNLAGVLQQYLDNDAMLAEALRKGLFVLEYQFLFGADVPLQKYLFPAITASYTFFDPNVATNIRI